MHDLVIRGGTVVDGSGAPGVVADVAVRDGRIAAVGASLGAAYREVDARGRLVTPGFVDIHTHYDGQATWDSALTPSSWHGVTTAVFGNCGVGFAPLKPGSADYLINLMQGVEDIPEAVLAEGIDFAWEGFAEYLAALQRRAHAIDFAAQLPHGALRFYVMGERGADHRARPTESELRSMTALTRQALLDGALGVSTSRTPKHRAADGRPTPSLSADAPELLALAEGLRQAGRGVLQVNADFGPGEFELLRQAAQHARRPLTVLLLQMDREPDLWRRTLAQIHAARDAGIEATGQVGAKAIGVLMGLDASRHPFQDHPDWAPLAGMSGAQAVAWLNAHPDVAARLTADDRPDTPAYRALRRMVERSFVIDADFDYEPPMSASLGERARREGTTVWKLALDALRQDDGTGLLMHPFENYSAGSLDVVREMLQDPATVMGLADAGAHVGLICDAAAPTFLLQHWARDRRRGPRLPLEFLVHKQTRATALTYGLADRGLLAPGMKADLNVIDFDALGLGRPRVVHDLPAGGKRLIQRARGYSHTFVSGVEILRDDELTGELPGRLVRG